MRHRDWLLAATGSDSDQLVHDLLIRFCAAFLDQGFASWPLLHKDSFFESFAALYGTPFGPPDAWLRGLGAELDRLQQASLTPLELIAESLELLGVTEVEQEAFLTQTLLALRGYAGMLWQVERRGDRVSHPVPPNTLVEFLAVRLMLDRLATEYVARTGMDYRGNLANVRDAAAKKLNLHSSPEADQRAFLVFQLAQLLGWSPETLYRLNNQEWSSLLEEIEAFSRTERRRIYQMAFERRYRIQTLDALALHDRRLRAGKKFGASEEICRPVFQIVCCLDEREESFRRHLEEVAPECETFSAAGFFGVAMYYRGAADAHFTPLCPVIVTPQHYVTENVVYTLQNADQRRCRRRRAIGAATRQVHVGSRTFAGGWLAGVLGSLASVPLVMRILFPRATARLRQTMGGLVKPPAATRLQLERSEDEPGAEGGHMGYRVEEMAEIVERILRDSMARPC